MFNPKDQELALKAIADAKIFGCDWEEWLPDSILKAFSTIRASEREECAKVAESVPFEGWTIGLPMQTLPVDHNKLATAIREKE